MRIAFLGLGIMGSRMAANLARAGHELTVWNRTAQRAQTFAREHGATPAAEPEAAVADAELIVSMLVDGSQVEAIVGRARAPETLWVDCSTIGPDWARRIGAHQRLLDAPVTGSSPRAQDGTLTFMVGGGREDFEFAQPVLAAMGRLIVYAGPLGQGQLVKVINNALAAINAAAVAQALLVARAAGADLDALVAVASAGSGGSAMLELKSGPMRAHDYRTLFKLDHMLKDVRLCLAQADGDGVPFGLAQTAEALLAAGSALGFGEQDFAALIEAAERDAGLRL
jgi:3-hydroxyisobutyrate dehydrogenase-like beta-hydroxyacid dehydrogenase